MWAGGVHPPRKGGGKAIVLTSKDIRKLLKHGIPEQTKLDQDVIDRFTHIEETGVSATKLLI